MALFRVSGGNNNVYVTISAYIMVSITLLCLHSFINPLCSSQLDNCSQPACLTKDLCMTIHSREVKPSVPRSFLSFLTGKKQESDE